MWRFGPSEFVRVIRSYVDLRVLSRADPVVRVRAGITAVLETVALTQTFTTGCAHHTVESEDAVADP